MAIVTPSSEFDFKNTPVFRKNLIVTWANMLQGDTGVGVLASGFPDKTAHINGTFGTATVRIEGSNNSIDGQDGNWALLRDPFNAALTFTSADLRQILENTKWVRVSISGGDGTTDITAIIFGSSHKDPK